MKQNWKTASLMVLLTSVAACSSPTTKTPDLDPADMDISISPAADFDEYANGGWKRNNPMPDEKSRFGSFDKLADLADLQLKEIFTELAEKDYPAGSIEKKISDFYKAGMDTVAIEAAGMQPVLKQLEQVDALKSKKELFQLMGQWARSYDNPFFRIGTGADLKNSEMQVLYVSQSGISMPDRDYYLKTDEKSQEIQAKYRQFVAGIFRLAGEDPDVAITKSETIYDIEHQMAEFQMSMLDRRDPFKTYNRMDLTQFSKLAPSLELNSFFEKAGLQAAEEFVVGQPDFFLGMEKLANKVSLEDWKTYLEYNTLTDLTDYGPKAWNELSFEFFGKTLKGQKAQRPRWKRIQSATSGQLGEGVGQIYVEKFFPEEAKTRMVGLVENLRAALGNRIKQLDWMSEETKEKALVKLDAIVVKVGYPDEWKDYSALEITNSHAQNMANLSEFYYNDMLSEINQPVNKKEWHMTPQTVNAYYSPTANEIVFPAAILQPPFFYMNGDDAINYGGIGVVIGHEITHGFDDRGRLYDEKGNLNEWWTAEDAEKFTAKADILVKQFDSFVVSVQGNDTIFANGELSLGENIADLGGLYISYDALQMALSGNEPLIDGFNPTQRFYLSYARLWAQNIREEEKIRLTNVDVHSLGRFRVNGALSNIPTFYDAFGIKEGDAMWLEEEKRALIW
ncbi:MAG: M13 family metallopeptidase [Mangrovibacterium sp.]